MIDTVKKFNIFDTFGNCYKLDDRNNLVVARDNYDATPFTFWEANARVGSGRRAHFYKILEADIPELEDAVSSDDVIIETDGVYSISENLKYTSFIRKRNRSKNKLFTRKYI